VLDRAIGYSFSAGRAFSNANRAVPDWSYIYCPTKKDANGKYIYDRKDFESHIKTHLIEHIEADLVSLLEWQTSHLHLGVP
jgi:hypothetical protein